MRGRGIEQRGRGRWGWRGPGNREGDRGEGDGIGQRARALAVLEEEARESGGWARVRSGGASHIGQGGVWEWAGQAAWWPAAPKPSEGERVFSFFVLCFS